LLWSKVNAGISQTAQTGSILTLKLHYTGRLRQQYYIPAQRNRAKSANTHGGYQAASERDNGKRLGGAWQEYYIDHCFLFSYLI